MAKAMLIMDMPSYCLECPCLNELDECEAMKYKDVGDIGRKPTWCPLREIPQKESGEFVTNAEEMGYVRGYNACIDEIQGGAEHG